MTKNKKREDILASLSEEIATEKNKALKEIQDTIEKEIHAIKNISDKSTHEFTQYHHQTISLLQQVKFIRDEIKEELESATHKIKEFEKNYEEKTKKVNDMLGMRMMSVQTAARRIERFYTIILWGCAFMGGSILLQIYMNPALRTLAHTLWAYW